jgi:hypothetical protein
MRTIAIALAVLVLIGCDRPQGTQQAKSDLSPREQAMVGEWLAQMVVTQQKIDEYHAAYPEGDRDEVAKYHEEWASRPLYILRLNADRTVTHMTGWGDRAGPPDEDTKWRLLEDGRTLVLTQTSDYTSRTSKVVDGKEVVEEKAGTSTSDMEYEVAADGKSFTDLPLREQRFIKKDSPEARAAFRDPEPIEPIAFAINVTRDDFVGTWKLDLSLIGDPTAFRATMSQKEVDELIGKFTSIEVLLTLKADGTWETKGEASKKGTWKYDENAKSAFLTPMIGELPPSQCRLSADKAFAYLLEPSMEQTPGGRFKRVD